MLSRLKKWARLIVAAFKVFSGWERLAFLLAAGLFVAGTGGLTVGLILRGTTIAPAVGGEYREIMIGGPRFLNPVLAPANDTDKDMVRLIYSGLLRYDEDTKLAPDLAERYTVSEDGKTYTFYLRKNVKWHDGELFDADDVLFTVRLLQDPEYQSPLRPHWQSVKAEKVDAHTVRLSLQTLYAPFLTNATVGILPKHLWQNVAPRHFGLAEENLRPVGTGPFRFSALEKEKNGRITKIVLERNAIYYSADKTNPQPHLQRLAFTFSEDFETALEALNSSLVDAVNFVSAQDLKRITRRDVKIYEAALPRYFAVFFNQNQSAALADKAVREALAYGTDREAIIAQALAKKAVALFGPFAPGLAGYTPDLKKRSYNPEQAKTILDKTGWRIGKGGVRERTETKKETVTVNRRKVLRDAKKTTQLEFSLLTANWPELESTARILKTQWEAIGARVNVELAGVSDIQEEAIRPRKYQALLFGEVLSPDPDPFSFWHSSQKRDPGLNLALYQNPRADKLLEEARRTPDRRARGEKYAEFQKTLTEDLPAIFLYSPQYLFPVASRIKGISLSAIATPADRFTQIGQWYTQTKRIRKKS